MKKNKEKSIPLHLTFRTIFHYIHGYWKDTLFAWFFVLFESAAETLVAFFMKDLVNGIKAQDMQQIGLYAGVVGALVLFAALTGILSGFWASSAACGFAANLRFGMYDSIQHYSFRNIDKFSTPSIITRTTTDVTNVQNAFQMTIRGVIRSPIMLVLALVLAFITEPKIAWVFILLIPIALTILLLTAKLTHPTFVRVFEEYDALNQSIQENVDGIRVVKSFNREEYEKKRFNKVSEFLYRNFTKAETILAFNSPTLNLAIDLALILLSYFGATLIVNSGGTELDTGSLTTLITYVQMIFMSLMMLSMIYVQITIARNSAERIAEILNEKSDIVNPDDGIMDVSNGEVEFRDVGFAYHKGKEVLSDISLSIPSGSTLGIIGSTGSGKTSLVNLIARLYDVDRGSVFVAGHDVRDYDVKALRNAVAVVLQKNTLFSGTVRSNLLWGDEKASDEELWAACDLAQASPFLKQFPAGLESPIDEGGTNVSGGQKQRLCIARALLKHPKILILDDSTSACDTRTDAMIRHGLMEEKKDITKIIIAQRVLSIKDCDQIVVLDNGRIADIGTNEELLDSSEIYRSLYESQLGGGGDFDAAD